MVLRRISASLVEDVDIGWKFKRLAFYLIWRL
jgi:hypothetical protein